MGAVQWQADQCSVYLMALGQEYEQQLLNGSGSGGSGSVDSDQRVDSIQLGPDRERI